MQGIKIEGLVFLSPDHLGSTSYISNMNGAVSQFVAYTAFGETFVEERNTDYFLTENYKYNGKELDEETGLYYYGARYYNPKISNWLSVDPIALYDPIDEVEHYLDGQHNGGYFNPANLSVYGYTYQNPIKYVDPNGKQIVAVHGTWSNNRTWKDTNGISKAIQRGFGSTGKIYLSAWSGGNYATMRTEAAKVLVQRIIKIRNENNMSIFDPITLIGHSHGGNVDIEAINMMSEMPEFDGVSFNLLTINTPVRGDYQLSENAQIRTNHINIYDTKDPVQANGGNSSKVLPDATATPNFISPTSKGTGEYGDAGRTFNNATNISVNNPQSGLLNKNAHNSHNRTKDWINKMPANE